MKKIIHVITRMDMGGSAQNTLQTCIGLDKRKYQVILVMGLSRESLMTDLEQETVFRHLQFAAQGGVRVIILDSLLRRINPLKDISAFYFLYRLFCREKPDIVHTHTSKAGMLGRWAAKLARVPVIVHTPHGHVFFGHFGKMVSKLFFYIEKLSDPITTFFVALTEGEKKDYIRLSLVHDDKVAIIHSGVDIRRFDESPANVSVIKKSLGLVPGAPVVGFIGWLFPVKGPMVLLEAMAEVWHKHPSVQLVYVGKGDLEVQLRLVSQQMEKKNQVHFLGWRDDVSDIIHVLDVLAVPSLNEGMGRVIIEAMAAAKPVVGSNVGGIPDLILDGGNGFLVPVGDVGAFSAAISELLDDEKKSKEMGRQGRLRATQYDQSKMVDKIDALYQQLAGE